jgi:hypothetical protein
MTTIIAQTNFPFELTDVKIPFELTEEEIKIKNLFLMEDDERDIDVWDAFEALFVDEPSDITWLYEADWGLLIEDIRAMPPEKIKELAEHHRESIQKLKMRDTSRVHHTCLYMGANVINQENAGTGPWRHNIP